MAEVYAPPVGVGSVPRLRDFMSDGKFDSKGMKEAEEKWKNELRTWCKKNSSGRKYVGEIIQEPVADGYAQYMVFSLRPLILIHLPIGDSYQFRWDRRWTAADVKSMVEQRKALDKFFKQKQS